MDAFRAEGLRVGFYYSLLDWHHPDYAIDVRGDAAAPVRNVKLEDVWLGAFRKSLERIENADGIQKCNVRLGDLDPKSWVQPIVEVWHGK